MADIYSRKYQEYGGRCAYCGKNLFTDLDTYMGSVLDHIIPLTAGEPDTDANLALSCATCNTLKGGFDPRQGAAEVPKHQLIGVARDYVFKRRSEKVKEFFDYLNRNERA